jgi:hypothetical protein
MIFQEVEDFFVHPSHPLARMLFGQGKEAPAYRQAGAWFRANKVRIEN